MVYVAFAGLIGVGKTTMAKRLADRVNGTLGLEDTKNPYLPLFYKDQHQHSFALQIDLMKNRMKDILADNAKSATVIHDRSIYEDSIFAKMLFESGKISNLNYTTYRSLFDIVRKLIPTPDVVVWLRASPEECLRRINKRERDYESGIPIEYMQELQSGYIGYMKQPKLQIVEVDCSGCATSENELEQQIDVVVMKIKKECGILI